MSRLRNREATLSLPRLRLEGALFLPDQLEKAAVGQAAQQTEADYLTPKGLKLRDDYSRAFQIACAHWRHFAARLERRDLDPARVTTDFVHELLRDALGYHSLSAVHGIPINERHYPITQLAAGLQVVIAALCGSCTFPLDKRAVPPTGSWLAKRSTTNRSAICGCVGTQPRPVRRQ